MAALIDFCQAVGLVLLINIDLLSIKEIYHT